MYLIKKVPQDEILSIRETVESLARTMSLPGNASTHLIFDRWPDVVGDYLSTQTRPITIRETILVIAAANPVVAKEISLQGRSIANLINGFLNSQVVTKIEVKTGANYARGFRRSD